MLAAMAASPQNAVIGFPSARHDHQACVDGALDRARALCKSRGVRLTEIRARILELIWDSHEPVGAYALLDALRNERHSAKPPTVYRALSFLCAQGLVHRIETLNAYVGCSQAGDSHTGQFLICRRCSRAVELNDAAIAQAVEKGCRDLGFTVEGQVVEVTGLCPDCRATAAKRENR